MPIFEGSRVRVLHVEPGLKQQYVCESDMVGDDGEKYMHAEQQCNENGKSGRKLSTVKQRVIGTPRGT